jgi:hypothetical protein
MDRPAITRIHRIESNRPSSISGSLYSAICKTAKGPFSLISATLDVYHDPGCILALPHRDLVGHELQRICRSAITTLKCFRSGPSKLKDKIIALG